MQGLDDAPRFVKKVPASAVAPSYKLSLPHGVVEGRNWVGQEIELATSASAPESWKALIVPRRNKDRREYTLRGWKTFCEAHGIQAGDHLSFELVHGRRLVIQRIASRPAPIPTGDSQDWGDSSHLAMPADPFAGLGGGLPNPPGRAASLNLTEGPPKKGRVDPDLAALNDFGMDTGSSLDGAPLWDDLGLDNLAAWTTPPHSPPAVVPGADADADAQPQQTDSHAGLLMEGPTLGGLSQPPSPEAPRRHSGSSGGLLSTNHSSQSHALLASMTPSATSQALLASWTPSSASQALLATMTPSSGSQALLSSMTPSSGSQALSMTTQAMAFTPGSSPPSVRAHRRMTASSSSLQHLLDLSVPGTPRSSGGGSHANLGMGARDSMDFQMSSLTSSLANLRSDIKRFELRAERAERAEVELRSQVQATRSSLSQGLQATASLETMAMRMGHAQPANPPTPLQSATNELLEQCQTVKLALWRAMGPDP